MARKNKEYTKLPGRGRAPFGVISADIQTLWLAADHLLLLSSHGYSEGYKRFKYENIQAVIVTKTKKSVVQNIIIMLLLMVPSTFVVIGLWKHWDIAALISLSVGSFTFLVMLIINLIVGPTCDASIYTSVQTERLYSLRRIRTAKRVLKILKPIIEERQGVLTEAHIEANGDVSQLQTRKTTSATTLHSPAAKQVKEYDGAAHKVLFMLFLSHMCMSCVTFFYNNMGVFLISAALVAGMIVYMIRALAKQQNSDLSDGLKILSWCALSYLFICTIASTYAQALANATIGGTQYNTLKYFKYLASISYAETVIGMVMLGIVIVVSGIIGFTGLVLLNNHLKYKARLKAGGVEDGSES